MINFKFTSLDPYEDIRELLLESNPELKEFINGKKYSFTNIKAIVPTAENNYCNTSIILKAHHNSGYAGAVTLYYSRINLNEYLDDKHQYQKRTMRDILYNVDIINPISDTVTTDFIGNKSLTKAEYDLYVGSMPFYGIYSDDVKYNPEGYPRDFISPTTIVHSAPFEIKASPSSLRYTPNSSFRTAVFFNEYKSTDINKLVLSGKTVFTNCTGYYPSLNMNKNNRTNIKSNDRYGKFMRSTYRDSACTVFNFNFSSCFANVAELEKFVADFKSHTLDRDKIEEVNVILRSCNAPHLPHDYTYLTFTNPTIVKINDNDILYQNFPPKEGFDRYVLDDFRYSSGVDGTEWCSTIGSMNDGYPEVIGGGTHSCSWLFYFPKLSKK